MTLRGTPVSRRSIWIVQAAMMLGLILYVLAVRLLAPTLTPGSELAPVRVGVVLALAPAALWLLLFYVQDSREPEPLGYVLRVAVAGAVLASAAAIPMLRTLASAAWAMAGPVTNLFATILLVGSVQEFAKYLAVRFTVYENDEFDEVADGVTYGTAAGVGLATILNLWLVLSGPRVDPLPMALRIVVTTLSHAAFGGVLGYGLGRAKMRGDARLALWGYLSAVILNGVVTYLLREVTTPGLTYRPWNGLALAAIVAIAVTALLLRMERAAVAQPAA